MKMADLERYLDMWGNIEARGRFYPKFMVTEASVKARLEKDSYWSDEFGSLLIVNNDDDRILGSIICFRPTFYFDAVELGYILHDQASRGAGIMTEAVGIVVKYLFAARNIHRIQICAEAENHASCRVAEKNGFTLEGVMRDAFMQGAEPRSLRMYSVIRSEYH